MTFARPVAPSVVGQLARLPGVLAAEPQRTVGIRIHHDQHERDSVLMGLAPSSTLRRLVERGGNEVPLPEGAILLAKTLGEILGVEVGDRPEIELREGERRTVRPVVAGFVDDSVGLFVYARDDLIAQLAGDRGAVSAALVKVDPRQKSSLEERLLRSPNIIDVSDVAADIQRLRDMNGAAMDIWTAISISLAASVIFGVVYNNARISLAMRSRDLASLRVLGFSRGEISSILIGGLAVEVLLAIPLGLWLGKSWSEFFFAQVDQETFRFQVVIEGRTYLLTVMVALLAAAASALWVRRSLRSTRPYRCSQEPGSENEIMSSNVETIAAAATQTSIALPLLAKEGDPAVRATRERKRSLSRRLRQGIMLAVVLAAAAGLIAALRPRPVPVDVATVKRGPLVVPIEESRGHAGRRSVRRVGSRGGRVVAPSTRARRYSARGRHDCRSLPRCRRCSTSARAPRPKLAWVPHSLR